jgi:preprotein translocase subunit Sec63
MKISVIFLLIVALISVNVNAESLYSVLGISKGATQREIKTAYKELAREWICSVRQQNFLCFMFHMLFFF